MKNFALIGAAGFVAPRHMKAIQETGNRLVIAQDPCDSVGIIDSYFPECDFYNNKAEFERELERRAQEGGNSCVDYVSICTPNYLHFDHVSTAMEAGADAICEKPLVIKPHQLDDLLKLEKRTGRRVYSIFQLRLHPSIIKLKKKLESNPDRKRVEMTLRYVTRRGPWYHVSWKGNDEKSGGLAMNIGIHFFDALIWLFGSVRNSELKLSNQNKVAGRLELEWADVDWHLSIDINDLPEHYREKGKAAFRSITMEGEELDFSDGFTDLHTVSYQEILANRGFGIEDARAALELVDSFNRTEIPK